MKASAVGRPVRLGLVMSGALVSALIINVALLLLIGGLISRRETHLTSSPNPQPVDFIRIVPKAEEPKPNPPPELKRMVDASSARTRADDRPRPPPGRVKPSRTASIATPPRDGQPKSGKGKATPSLVSPPRIEIPEQAEGSTFAAVPGSDPRLTASPAQWDRKKTATNTGDKHDSPGGTGGEDGGGSQVLVVLSRVMPDYPPQARARGIEGWVQIEIVVSPSGTVSSAKVVDANPARIFDQAALEAIRRWRFKPAFREGRAVEQRATQKLSFRLEKRR